MGKITINRISRIEGSDCPYADIVSLLIFFFSLIVHCCYICSFHFLLPDYA